jgi:hypothetical protein
MKTFKREVAAGLLIWLIYLVETKHDAIIEILVWPVFAFAAAAFGLDAASKQLHGKAPFAGGRRNERGGEYTDRPREQPDRLPEHY